MKICIIQINPVTHNQPEVITFTPSIPAYKYPVRPDAITPGNNQYE